MRITSQKLTFQMRYLSCQMRYLIAVDKDILRIALSAIKQVRLFQIETIEITWLKLIRKTCAKELNNCTLKKKHLSRYLWPFILLNVVRHTYIVRWRSAFAQATAVWRRQYYYKVILPIMWHTSQYSFIIWESVFLIYYNLDTWLISNSLKWMSRW